MKRTILVLAMLSGSAIAQQINWHDGYTRQNGSYVAPHYQSAPDASRMNNLGAQNSIYGGVNPYTGERGRQRDELSYPPVYNQPRAPSFPISGYPTANPLGFPCTGLLCP